MKRFGSIVHRIVIEWHYDCFLNHKANSAQECV